MRGNSFAESTNRYGTRARGIRHEDCVSSERSSYRHWVLEKAIVDLCVSNGITPLTNNDIDLLVQSNSTSIIFEVKFCPVGKVGTQMRNAISQLLEYRFLYRERLRADVRLCVVSERRPSNRVGWMLSYLESLGIGIIWKDEQGGGLACSDFTKRLLGDVLPGISELSSVSMS